MLSWLAGCASISYPIRSMEFESKTSGWRLEYYGENMLVANHLKAFYELNDEITMQLAIGVEGTYYEYLVDALILFIPLKWMEATTDMCEREKNNYIKHLRISFVRTYNKSKEQPVEPGDEKLMLHGVSFDSNSVYIVKKDGEIVFGNDTGTKINREGIYDLAARETLENRPLKFTGWKDVVQIPIFYYSLPLSCVDYEGATLVIDGLYYKAKQLPPLRVHMKYIDFSKVPHPIR